MKLKNMILIVISLSILLIITGSTIIISKFPNIVKDVSLVNVNIDLKSFSISYKWKDCIANFSEVSFNKNIEKIKFFIIDYIYYKFINYFVNRKVY